MKHALLYILFFVFSSSVFAQSNIGRGKAQQLYQIHCAVCHGNRGQGGLGGSLIEGKADYAPDDESKARVIREGIEGMDMQGFADRLSEKEIRSLVIYIRELKALQDAVPPKNVADGVYESQRQRFRLETVAENPKNMWGLTFMPDGRFLATEINGNLRFISKDGTLQAPVSGTPKIARRGQGGLLDVALDPEYQENGWVYLVFAEGSGNSSMTSLVRGKIFDNTWKNEEVLFKAKPEHYRNAGVHFGSRIVFQDDYVFFSIGDRGAQDQAQSLQHPNGKIYRLHRDGRIPKDNPFVDSSPYPGIWSYGHRNPQALAFRPGTDELWSTEHGPRGGDELNRIVKGKNYGWPKVTFGMNYNGTPITEHTSLPGLEAPVWHWTPSIAVCGMAFSSTDLYPDWKGDLFVGGLRSQVIERLRIGENGIEEREIIFKDQGRVRDIKQGPDGSLYVILEGSGSRLIRIQPQSPQ
jgi:glucose/arabinose dehydrogenase